MAHEVWWEYKKKAPVMFGGFWVSTLSQKSSDRRPGTMVGGTVVLTD